MKDDKYDRLTQLLTLFIQSVLGLELDMDLDLSDLQTDPDFLIRSKIKDVPVVAPAPVPLAEPVIPKEPEPELPKIKCANPLCNNLTSGLYCSPECAQPVIPPHSVVIMHDGTIVDKKGIVQVKRGVV